MSERKVQATFILWPEVADAIMADFGEDWHQNKTQLINEMLYFALEHNFRITKPILREMREQIRELNEDVAKLKLVCKIQ